MNPSAFRAPSRLQKPPQRNQNLQISGLPRYHPANFTSPSAAHLSSEASSPSTPYSHLDSPQAPVSPRQQQNQYSESQRALFLFQRDGLSTTRPHSSLRSPTGSLRAPRPISPKLQPLGSPGPVTPLELEEKHGYLFVNVGGESLLSAEAQDQIVQGLISRESGRRSDGLHHRRSCSNSLPGSRANSRPATPSRFQ